MRSQPRARVAAELASAGGPSTASAVASALDLHVTTARHHLEALVSAGEVVRVASPSTGERGRPEFSYVLVDVEAARGELIDLLVGIIESGGGPDAALAAGEDWATGISLDDAGLERALERELGRRGFAPERTSAGFELHACPFEEAARRAPGVVCTLHLGLTRGLAARAEGTWEVTLEPFVTPASCRVGLSREASVA